jgi:hypothetical protein
MPDDEIELAFQEVKLLVRRMIEGEGVRNETLSALFKLNNEVGRRARTNQELKQKLIPLQHHVNAITVGVKSSDSKLMEESVSAVEQILGKFRNASEAKRSAQ